MTTFRPFARDDIRALLTLKVRDDQDDFVGSNAITIAQSIFEPASEIFGIWDGGTAVGMMAIIDMTHPGADLDEGDDPNGIYLWRLLIDSGAQGQGHGTAAVAFTLDLARKRGRAHVTLSAVPENAPALALYERLGFTRTGRIVDGEVELTCRL